eukprot:scaffold152034_cov33-Attheya_sp.AAC.1
MARVLPVVCLATSFGRIRSGLFSIGFGPSRQGPSFLIPCGTLYYNIKASWSSEWSWCRVTTHLLFVPQSPMAPGPIVAQIGRPLDLSRQGRRRPLL